MIPTEKVTTLIEQGFPGAQVQVEDLTGTSDHFRATIVAPQFAGKSRIERHQMVYAVLHEEMKGAIHALSLTTKTPEEK